MPSPRKAESFQIPTVSVQSCYSHRGANWLICSVQEYLSDSVTYEMALPSSWASQVALVVKNPPASAGGMKDLGLTPELGRSPGGGDGNPLQCSYLENPVDRGAWEAMVHKITKSQTGLKRLSMHAYMHTC